MPVETAKSTDREIVLRPVKWEEDGAFLRRVYASTRAEELAITGWSEEQKAAFCEMQFTAQDSHYRKHYPTAAFLVIENQGAPIGRLYVDRCSSELQVIDISLLAEHRGAGVGTLLLSELQSEARAAGKVVSIHVEKFNHARRLYERLGFRVKEDKDIYLLMEWQA